MIFRSGVGRILGASALVWGLWALEINEAFAQSKAACVDAYKQGQVRRKDGELRAARGDFQTCSSAACPAVLRRDCAPWKEQVEAAIPSIVVAIKNADGQAIEKPRIFVDGESAEALMEKAKAQKASSKGAKKPSVEKGEVLGLNEIELDPGAHVLRVEADEHEPVEQSVKLRSGEKRTRVEIVLRGAGEKKQGAQASEAPNDSEAKRARPLPASAIAFGVIGLAGIGAFTGFGLHGRSLKSDLEACKPACDPARVDVVKRDFIIADASLAVGIVFLGLATYSFVTRPEVPAAAQALNLQAGPGGAMLSWRGLF